MDSKPEQLSAAALRTENAHLIALLESHGILWQLPPVHPAAPVIAVEHSRMSTVEKVALFRRLFRGRTDVYPIRWESEAGLAINHQQLAVRAVIHAPPVVPVGFVKLADFHPRRLHFFKERVVNPGATHPVQ